MNVFNRLASLSIRTRLMIVVLVAILFMIITGLVAVSRFSTLAQPAAESALQVVAKERSAILNQVATRLVSVPKSLAQISEVQTALAQLVAQRQPSDETLNIVRGAFQQALNDNLSIQQVRFVTLQGKVLVSVPTATSTDDSTAPYFEGLQTEPISGDNVYIGKLVDKPLPTFDLVTLVNSAGKAIGYLVVSADPTGKADTTQFNVYSALQTANYSSGSVIFYLVNNDQASTLESPFNPPLSVGDDTKLTTRLLTTRVFTRPALLPSPLTGQRALLYVTPVGDFGKWLVAESRVVQIGGEGEVGAFNLQLALLILGFVGILALIGFWFDSTLIPPLQRLQTFATQVVQGRERDTLKTIQQNDEIGALAGSINTISTQLQTNIQTLQDRLADRVRDIEATREIGQIISSLRDVDPLLEHVVSLLQQRFPQIHYVLVYLIDDKGENAVLRIATDELGGANIKPGHRIPVGSAGLIGRVAVEGRSLVTSDPNLLPTAMLPDTQVELALPLRLNLDQIGVLDLHSSQPDAFAEDDVKLFQTVADQLAIAITNARLFEQSQARLHEIESLNRQFLTDAWRNYANQRRRGQAAAGNEPWSDLQVEAMQTGHVVERRQDSVVTVAIPILLRGVVLGVVECDIPQTAYNENVRMLAFELANRLAVTADSARLFDQSVRAAEREALINEISGKLTQQTEVSQILQVAVKELGQALRVPQTSIRLTRAKSASQQGERKN